MVHSNFLYQAYLPGIGVNHDHEGGKIDTEKLLEGGSPRARLIHCTSDELTSAISPNVGNSDA